MSDTLYFEISLLVSGITTLFLVLYTSFSAKRYHKYHDDRAAIDLAVAISLAVASLGLTVNAIGAVFLDPFVSLAGRAVSLTAIFLCAVVLLGYEWDNRSHRTNESGK